MNILLVTYSYPPINNAQAIRWGYLVESFINYGHQVTVLVPNICRNESFYVKKCESGITVRLLARGRSKNLKDKKSLRFLLHLYENLVLGDAYAEWAFRLLFCLRKVKLKLFDVVIFSSEPHIANLIPVIFVDHPNIVVDIGDPPVAGYFSGIKFFQRFQEQVFSRVLKKTKGVVYTGFSAKRCLEDQFPFLREKKSVVIHQGYLEDIEDYSNLKVISDKRLKLLYAGHFLKDIRDPNLLVKVLDKFRNDVLFVYAGSTYWSQFFERRLKHNYFYLGSLSNKEVISYYRKMDVLLYLGNSNSCQQSGKYFEYLGAGKPILHIFQNFNDDTIPVFTLSPVGLSSYYEELSLTTTISRMLEYYRSGNLLDLAKRLANEFVRGFSWNELAKKYLLFLEDIVGEKSNSKDCSL